MPELPEVETIKRELEKIIIGKKIVDVFVNNAKVIRESTKENFIKELKNIEIKKIIRKGKLLIFELSSGKFLTIHLKMSGQLVYPGNNTKSRLTFKLSDGKLLDFNDTRLFGELKIVDDFKDLKFIQELGPEPFDINIEQFRELIKNRKTKIKVLVMDQKIISGIGNLYANEALFKAKIDPRRPTNTLSNKEINLLFTKIKATLLKAIKYGGSSVDDYVRVSGNKGDYVKYLEVYGKAKEKCVRCGKIIQRISLGGRGTFFCPNCQK